MRVEERLRALPPVDRLAAALVADAGATAAEATSAARAVLERRRAELLGGDEADADLLARGRERLAPSLRRVLNATGVVVHTNLGRAPLPDAARAAVARAAEGYANLELDLDTGDRGSRQYVRYAAAGGRQGSPPLRSIRAMVLFDMVGDCDLRIPREASSDRGLYGLFAHAAGRDSPFGGRTGAILDDQTPFERARIPALDLIDLDYGPGPPPGAWWHTTKDDLAHVCPSSLAAVGVPALAAIPRIR